MKKPFALALGALTLAFAPTLSAVPAYPDVTNLTGGLETFVNDATGSLPFAAAAGLDWSDAYIGNVVAVPPHFGIGATLGVTTLPGKAVKPLVEALGGSLPMADLPLPNASINARIGGVILPFDVGLKLGTIPGGITLGDYAIDYQNYGLDVRYALFQGEPLLPNLSVGAGVDYFKAGVSASYGSALNFGYGGHNIGMSKPKVSLNLEATTFEAKAEVSKSLLILTPYLGLSLLAGSATADAGIKSTIDTSDGGLAYWQTQIPGLSAVGFGKSKSVATFGAKVFGGTSINLLLLRLDLQGMYNLFDGAWGATLGTRFQL